MQAIVEFDFTRYAPIYYGLNHFPDNLYEVNASVMAILLSGVESQSPTTSAKVIPLFQNRASLNQITGSS